MERLSHAISLFREHFRAWLRVALILCVLGLLFFVTGGGISHNEKWQINQINISGTDTDTSDVVRSLVRQKLDGNYYFVYAHSNSYLFPKADIEKMLLETFPRMKSVVASRVDDHTISIISTERRPYALWCGDMQHPELSSLPQCWFVDDAGYVFDHAPSFSDGVYLEMYGKLTMEHEGEPLRGVIPHARFVTADTFCALARESVGKPLLVNLKDEGEDEVIMQSSAQHPFLSSVSIRFNDDTPPETLIKNLSAAIDVQFPDNTPAKDKLLYIDMRFGNKVIFGFENK